MEFITNDDINLVHSSGGTAVNDKTHKELVSVYKKLEHLCKLLKKKGYGYDIRKDPRSQGGGFKYFQYYQWAKIYPPGFKKYSGGKFSYIIGISNNLHFHMMGIGPYQDKEPSQRASKKSNREIAHQNSNYDKVIEEFITFDNQYRDLFIQTAAELGISYFQNIIQEKMIKEKVNLLKYKNQIILQGPPGTGKTRLAKILATEMIPAVKGISEDDIENYLFKNLSVPSVGGQKEYIVINLNVENKEVEISRESGTSESTSFQDIIDAYKKKMWESNISQNPPRIAASLAKFIYDQLFKIKVLKQFKIIQFHPAYTYEDFVRGIIAKPNHNGEGILYEAENKTLGIFAREALENFHDSKKSISALSKEKWIEKMFHEFVGYIAEELESGPVRLNKEAKIIKIEDDKFKYNCSPDHSGYPLFFRNIQQKFLETSFSENKSSNDKDLNDIPDWHERFYKSGLELFKKFLNEKNKSLSENGSITEKVPLKNYVLVIDEINRANLPSVLGELIYALEYREEEVESIYEVKGSRKIILPPNLYIIGTMNTADRSVGHIDYAIRRRFAFVDVLPNKEVVHPKAERLFKSVSELFIKDYDNLDWAKPQLEKSDFLIGDFRPEDVWIGHSYFISTKDDNEAKEELKLKLEYEIKPLLKEYIKDGILTEDAKTKIEELDGQLN